MSEANFDFFQSETDVNGSEAVDLEQKEVGGICKAMNMNVIFPENVAKR